MLLQRSVTHVSTLLQLLLRTYFASLSTVLIVYEPTGTGNLPQEYLDALQRALRQQTEQGHIIGLQWINVANLSRTDFNERMLRAVDMATEGFITILTNTTSFLHARYYATRYGELRLKDKRYLFLCEHENPQDFLAAEILQFYPHHLMIRPAPASSSAEPAPAAVNKISQTILNKFPAATVGIAGPEYESQPVVKPTTRSSAGNWSRWSRWSRWNSWDQWSSESSMASTPVRTHRDINFELWTQKFVGAVGNLDAVLLDAFLPNETFVKNVELYPNKVSNLKGRAVRVGSITYIPYVVTNYVAAGAGNVDPINANGPNRSISYVGSEADIVKTFCQVRNCHLRVEPYGVDNWGAIYENESSSGMMGDIYTQRVELAIGCIYNWYNNITETSHTIARSAVTVLGPAPPQFPAWRTNVLPFTFDLWLFLIGTMLLCSFVLYFIKYSSFTLRNWQRERQRRFRHMKTFEEASLDIFAVFIQQPSAKTDLHRFAARAFLATLLCATITLENTYSGQLKSILTIPSYNEPVDTMDKWSQTNWKWGAPSIVWIQTVEKSDLLKEQILTRKFETHDYSFLYNASFRSDYGLGIERLLSGAFSFGHFITAAALETKIVPKDDLYFDWTRAVSIRGWPLMPLFNKHVRACMETGLFVHWERQMSAKYLERQTQVIMLDLASGHTNKMPPKKLTTQNVSGALFILLIGYTIALITFVLEIICSHPAMNIFRYMK